MSLPSFIVHDSSGIDYMPPTQLARELSATYRTTLFGPVRRWWEIRGRRLSVPEIGALSEYYPYQFPRRGPLAALTDPWSTACWARAVTRLSRGEEPVVILDRPTQHLRIGAIQARSVAYYAHCDYTLDIVGPRYPQLAQLEQQMLEKVDVAFAASQDLVTRFRKHAKRVVHFPCFYDPVTFNPARAHDTPSEMIDIPFPRILFSGYISGRIDFDGMSRTARERPDWSFVFLGAKSASLEDELEATGRSRDCFSLLLGLPNVRWLGSVPQALVPPYVAAADVGLVPYCLSKFTKSSSPQKVYEYLAMGKPVVATKIPDTITVSRDIHFSEESESYSLAIEAALAGAADPVLRAERLACVRKHSVCARAETMVEALLGTGMS